jgi:hypothetical protein
MRAPPCDARRQVIVLPRPYASSSSGVETTVAIIVGLASGVVGAIVTARIRFSHEREKLIRDRMLAAGDDFATAVFHAIVALQDAHAAALRHGRTESSGQLSTTDRWGKRQVAITDPWGKRLPEVDVAYREAGRRIDEALARYTRIQLLFGIGTQAEKAARSCAIEMQAALANLDVSPFPNFPAYTKALTGLSEWHESFGARAHEAIRGERWRERITAKIQRRERMAVERLPDEARAGESSPSTTSTPTSRHASRSRSTG